MLIFIHIHKTGGTTIRYILRSSYGLDHCDAEPWHAKLTNQPFNAQDLHRLRKVYPGLKSIAGHRITGYEDLDENHPVYFTFMRDPIKTLASHFQFNVQKRNQKHLVFEKWVQEEWKRNRQTKMIAGTENVEDAIRIIQQKNVFVGITERFQESLLLLKYLVDPGINISYKRVNIAQRNSIADEILASPRTRSMLVEANQADIELYNYVVHEIYPQYVDEYGSTLEKDLSKFQVHTGDFNWVNLNLSRVKRYLVYKPLLFAYRKGINFI